MIKKGKRKNDKKKRKKEKKKKEKKMSWVTLVKTPKDAKLGFWSTRKS